MDLQIMIEPQQGASYDTQLAVARRAEQLGFSGFMRSDHFLRMGPGSGLPGPTDAWPTLAGLARDTTTIRLGTMVTSATFRLPGPLAITVAEVDQMSGGRVTLGIGAGWFEQEHRAYGIPFPDVATRFDRLEEQLAIITGLWATPVGDTFSYEGRHYTLADAPALPKPVQSPLPVIIGGKGPRRTPALVARHAQEYNAGFVELAQFPGLLDNVRQACQAIDRDPATVVTSAALTTCVGADEAEFTKRAAAIGRTPEELRSSSIAGTVPEAIAALERWRDAGAQRAYLQVLDLDDLEHLDLIAAEVAPALA